MSLTRRETLLSLSGSLLFGRQGVPQMSVEGYIFQQYAARQTKTLGDVLEEVFEMAHAAGFHNIELNQSFFTPDLRDRTIRLVQAKHLKMPSVYVGGAAANALEIAKLCRPFGCVAVVNNPDPKPAAAQKSDEELTTQAAALNQLGRSLKDDGFELRVHHHTPELVDNAREWRHILRNTDPQLVALCLDLDWVHQGGFKPLDLWREAGNRVHEIHIRNSKDKLWLEDLEDGDVDYRQIAAFMKQQRVQPLVVVELAYRENTVVTRSLTDDLRLSRTYAEGIFRIKA